MRVLSRVASLLALAMAPGLSRVALGQALPRQSIDLERFKPYLTADGFVVTEGTAVRNALPGDPIQLGLTLNGALNPLVVVGANNGVVNHLVSRRFGADLLASMTIVDRAALGVGLPLFFAQAGDLNPNGGGIGDLRLVPKLRITDDRTAPFGLALLTELRLPTHSDDEFSGGARSVVLAPKLALDHRFPLGIRPLWGKRRCARSGDHHLRECAGRQ